MYDACPLADQDTPVENVDNAIRVKIGDGATTLGSPEGHHLAPVPGVDETVVIEVGRFRGVSSGFRGGYNGLAIAERLAVHGARLGGDAL